MTTTDPEIGVGAGGVEADLTATPKLRPDVRVGRELHSAGRRVHYLKDPQQEEYFRVGVKEVFVLRRLDGRHTLAEIGEQYAATFDRRLASDHWDRLLGLLAGRGLLTADHAGYGAPNGDGAPEGMSAPNGMGALGGKKAPVGDGAPSETLTQRPAPQHPPTWRRRAFPLMNPDASLGRLARRLAFAFRPIFVVPAFLAVLGLELVVVMELPTLWHDIRHSHGRPVYLPASIVLAWLILAVHESAHGLVCKHFGGAVPEIGIMWRLPVFGPYCKVDDVVVMPHRRQAAFTALAGVFTSLLALVPFLALWSWSPQGSLTRGLGACMLVFGSLGAVINLMPFLQLDGYFAINHALGMADLRIDSYQYARRTFAAARLGGTEVRTELRGYSKLERWVYPAYVVGSVLFAAGAVSTIVLIALG